MLKIELEHQGLKLHGWITTPEGARQQSDLQYCYVNGRMMRDKLINHAIRQSYETSLRPDQFATYVLFIELDPHQVDVNVHPAKHEVRFHQARLVHDFIYQALSDGLAQSKQIDAAPINQSAFHQSEVTHHQQDSSMSEMGMLRLSLSQKTRYLVARIKAKFRKGCDTLLNKRLPIREKPNLNRFMITLSTVLMMLVSATAHQKTEVYRSAGALQAT